MTHRLRTTARRLSMTIGHLARDWADRIFATKDCISPVVMTWMLQALMLRPIKLQTIIVPGSQYQYTKLPKLQFSVCPSSESMGLTITLMKNNNCDDRETLRSSIGLEDAHVHLGTPGRPCSLQLQAHGKAPGCADRHPSNQKQGGGKADERVRRYTVYKPEELPTWGSCLA